jgi:hypothetical protein
LQEGFVDILNPESAAMGCITLPAVPSWSTGVVFLVVAILVVLAAWMLGGALGGALGRAFVLG